MRTVCCSFGMHGAYSLLATCLGFPALALPAKFCGVISIVFIDVIRPKQVAGCDSIPHFQSTSEWEIQVIWRVGSTKLSFSHKHGCLVTMFEFE